MIQPKRVFYSALMGSIYLVLITSTMAAELKFATQEFAPFNYKTGDVISGPVADIIRKTCKEMKISCSFNRYHGHEP